MNPKTMPYGELERDLCRIASERVEAAINSVLQLADSPETKFLISLRAMSQAVAMCGGTFNAVYGTQGDAFDVAMSVLQVARETGSSTGGEHHGN